jgi:Ca2+-binding RTX toxin-like protein
MATYQWTTLTTGQTVTFNSGLDLLDFGSLNANAVRLVGLTPTSTLFIAGGKSVTVSGLGITQIVSRDIFSSTFQNVRTSGQSRIIVGDNSTANGDDGANDITLSGFAEGNLVGLGGNDTLRGSYGNDLIDGGAGDDVLDGGDAVFGGVDTVSYMSAASGVTVSLALAGPQNTFGAGVDTLSRFRNLTGSAFDDKLFGDGGNNVVIGGAGNDLMDGGAGTDTVDYAIAAAGVTVGLGVAGAQNTGGAGTDTLAGFENLAGSAFDDSLTGSDAANILDGQAGNDTLSGGGGDDQLTGGTGNDKLAGGDGNDQLSGGAGDDSLDGGAGTDTASYSDAAAGVTVNLNAGTASNGGGTESVLNVENVIGGSGDDLLIGSVSDNLLTGGSGFDTLAGLAGNDTLDGGLGTDTADYSGATAGVTVNLSLVGQQETEGAGRDTLISIERLRGSSFADTLTGSGGQDLLDGGLGDDRIDGASGRDLVSYSSAPAGVTVDLGSAGPQDTHSAGTDTLTNIEDLEGSAFDDALTGDSAANEISGYLGHDTLSGAGGDDVLRGWAGNDSLDGGAGDDLLFGGAGNDVLNGGDGIDEVSYELATSAISVNLGIATAQNTGSEGSDSLLGIEVVTGTSYNDTLLGGAGNDLLDGGSGTGRDSLGGGSGDDTLLGSAGADTLAGGDGDDLLVGGYAEVGLSGSDPFMVDNTDGDSMSGGRGNDTYQVTASRDQQFAAYTFGFSSGSLLQSAVGKFAADQVAENPGEGTDTVQSYVSYTLPGNVENLQLMDASFSINGSGNDLNNVISGNTKNNVLSGGSGNDTLLGGTGNDTLAGDDGNDQLDGGTGNDTLAGGTGSDMFVMWSTPGDASVDTVTDFQPGNAGDSVALPLWRMDADSYGSNPFATGNARLTVSGPNVIVEWDADGASGPAAFQALAILQNISKASLTASNFQGFDPNAAPPIMGTPGNDNIEGTAGADLIDGIQGNDTLAGLAGDDALLGGQGDDTLIGGLGNDTLIGGAGNDGLQGNAGDDVYLVDSELDIVTEAPGEGIDRIDTALASYTLGNGVENLTYTGSTNFAGIGNTLANSLVGAVGNDALDGLAGNDTLIGLAGNDTLDGGAGNDILIGGMGDDVFVLDTAADVVVETAAGGIDRVDTDLTTYALGAELENLSYTGSTNFSGSGQALDNSLTGAAGNDTLAGNAGNDTLSGNGGNDSLDGGLGNDLLKGGSGNDTLDGGADIDALQGDAGDDLYVVDVPTDVIIENPGEGIDQANVLFASTGTYIVAANVEHAKIANATAGVNLTGNTLDNLLIGNSTANLLSGLAGNDTLDGGAGADTLVGGSGDDSYIVDVAADVITENLDAGIDQVDVRFAGAGTFTLAANVDNATITNATLGVNLTGNALANTLLGNSQANLLSGLDGNDSLDGAAGNDVLLGGTGDDRLDAGTGIDTVDGGADTDTLVLLGHFADYARSRPNATDTRLVNPGTGEDITSRNVESFRFVDGIKTLIDFPDPLTPFSDSWKGTESADTADGLAGNDTLLGLGGNDTLIGGPGNDSLVGGTGDDTYVVDVPTDVITEAPDEGKDQVNVLFAAAGTFVLAANVDKASIGNGTAGVNLTGNALDNELQGNATANLLTGLIGNDTLDGGAGIDTLVGGTGDDTYVVDVPNDVITENAGEGYDQVNVLFAAPGTFTLAPFVNYASIGNATAGVNLTGNDLYNELTGNDAANVLSGLGEGDLLKGLGGNDTLIGGTGNDTLQGNDGNDLYLVDSALDVVTEAAGEGTDRVETALASYTLSDNVETLTYTGALAFSGTGNAGNNSLVGAAGNDTLDGLAGDDTLIGNAGNDRLIGGAGNDSLVGGLGDDSYVVGETGDVVVEAAAGGIDRIDTDLAAYTLGTEVENLTYIGAGNFTGSGQALNNRLTGGAGDDNLSGLAGNDTLTGLAGNDTLDGGAGADTLVGGSGNDSYIVDVAADAITENLDEGVDHVDVRFAGAGTFTLAANVDNATITNATLGVNLTGNSLANTLLGNGQANLLSGLDGNDSLDGAAGNDVLLGGTGMDTLTAGTGIDTVDGGADTDTLILDGTFADYARSRPNATDTRLVNAGTGEDITIRNVESFRFADGTKTLAEVWDNALTPFSDSWTGTESADIADGLAGDDTLVGAGGNDTLIGGPGKDSLAGGTGDDTYVVDVPTDVITEAPDEGSDQVNVLFAAAGTFVLAANVDKASIGNGTAGVNLTGNALDNELQGNATANLLTGLIGNDTLDGGAGIDTLVGGIGDDSYVVDVPNDVITENAGEGYDQVNVLFAAPGTFTLAPFVNYASIGNATAGVNLTGNDLYNELTGNDAANVLSGLGEGDLLKGLGGNDTLIGGTGNDTLQGNDGNDLYLVDSALDVVSEAAGEGTDRVDTALASYTLSDNVETLTYTGALAFPAPATPATTASSAPPATTPSTDSPATTR